MKPQILNIQTHDSLKLIFISVHNEDSKNIGIHVQKKKSEWALKNHKVNLSAQKVFDSGFTGAVLMTNLQDWKELQIGPFDFATAYNELENIYSSYEKIGYKRIGRGFIKGKSIPGVPHRKWNVWKKSKVSNKTMKQFHAMCTNFLIAFPLDSEEKEELINKAYYATYLDTSLFDIQTKADVFQFLYVNQNKIDIYFNSRTNYPAFLDGKESGHGKVQDCNSSCAS